VTSEVALRLLLELSVGATVVLASAAIVLWLLRRRTAALRHRILALALGSLFVLPLVPAWLPTPAWLAASIPAVARPLDPGPFTESPDSSPVGSDPSRANVASTLPRTPLELAFGLWILVGSLLLAREGLGRLGAARLTRSAVRIMDGTLAGEALEMARRLRIRRRVRLCSTGAIASPGSVGLLKPHVFVPADAVGWPAGRRRVALLHELAHVARNDDLVQLAGRTVRAFYWFHPLAWWAVRELRRLAEEACDDVVLREHGDPCGYAEELLGFAQRQGVPSPAVVCFMTGTGNLERRVQSILDAARSRAELPRSASVGALVSTLIAVLAIGSCGSASPRRSEAARDGDPVTDWLASQHADDSNAGADGGLDERWRQALREVRGRSWIGYAVDLGIEDPTIFKRDVVISELSELVEPMCPSLVVIVEVSASRGADMRILDVEASNTPRVLDPKGAPFQWLGQARQDESFALLHELESSASGEARGMLHFLLREHGREPTR
jgi:beta-lactamase regulating signal transducer with metallopeptidase domain